MRKKSIVALFAVIAMTAGTQAFVASFYRDLPKECEKLVKDCTCGCLDTGVCNCKLIITQGAAAGSRSVTKGTK